MLHEHENIKQAFDGASIAGIAGIFFNILPHFVAILSGIWVVMRMYESYLGAKKLKMEIKEIESKKEY